MEAGHPLSSLLERTRSLVTGFGAYSAFGSFALYLLGYLALRFHLTAMGIATDLAVLDERYLFAGANFLVFIGTTLPIALLAGAFLAGALLGPYRVLPLSTRQTLADFCKRRLASPDTSATVGIVVALAMIQLFMRRCFFFSNVLVKPALPVETPWLDWLLVHGDYLPLYFSFLLLGLLSSLVLWVRATSDAAPATPRLRWKRRLLSVLIAIQALLFPMNYGVLVFGKALPKVTTVGSETLPDKQAAYLVWEGKETITYVVVRPGRGRSLVVLPRAESKKIEIVGYASLPELFSADFSGRNHDTQPAEPLRPVSPTPKEYDAKP